jgi:hypothetical protein
MAVSLETTGQGGLTLQITAFAILIADPGARDVVSSHSRGGGRMLKLSDIALIPL